VTGARVGDPQPHDGDSTMRRSLSRRRRGD
jgi:hypothetical protein